MKLSVQAVTKVFTLAASEQALLVSISNKSGSSKSDSKVGGTKMPRKERKDKGKPRGSYKDTWYENGHKDGFARGIARGIAIGINMAARALQMPFQMLSAMIRNNKKDKKAA